MLNTESMFTIIAIFQSVINFCLFRNMLSSAHVLAMDAKNLLDVVDGLRLRYPELFLRQQQQLQQQQMQPHIPEQYQPEHHQSSAQSTSFQLEYTQHPQNYQNDENYQVMTCGGGGGGGSSDDGQTYQNMSQIHGGGQQNSPPTSLQIQSNYDQQQSDDLYANQPNCGIYDNECVISQQMRLQQIDENHHGGGPGGALPPKPPVAAKPSNLHQKLKITNRQWSGGNTIPSSSAGNGSTGKLNDESTLNESLKIVEDDQDNQLYSNQSMMASAVTSSLEPVSCTIVQENVFQTVSSNKNA